MGDFLTAIAKEQRERLAREERLRTTRDLRAEAEARRPGGRPFVERLRRPPGERLRVIAEAKKASPSAGVLRAAYDPAALAAAYESAGAAAVSILTEPSRFLGSMEHLAAARARTTLPILCKDFVVHERQIYEAKARGADAVLLIATLLSPGQLRDLGSLAAEVGLETLTEVSDEGELDRALGVAGAIGVNNRDLRSLAIVRGRAERILARVPPARVRVAESGYQAREELDALTRAGIDAVLIGESLLRASSVEEAFVALFGPPGAADAARRREPGEGAGA
ncbi:MAG TPA: indole-3-glycerol phosphate synthase TrpC [Candidatus Eisenbacteria bacterium]|jgi:indole-3-glycerol phosphate synthase